MKIYLPENLNINLRDFLRRQGYSPWGESYVKRVSRDHYPRFHIYAGTDKSGQTFFNLHLDQKQASYEGSRAHSGEHDSEVVVREGERLQAEFLNPNHLISNEILNSKP